MFTMTYNEAVTIQQAQMVYYRNLIGRAGVKAIKKATICPVDINPNLQMKVSELNTLVPRGGDFERFIRYTGQRSCPNNLDWHNAIRAGKIYN